MGFLYGLPVCRRRWAGSVTRAVCLLVWLSAHPGRDKIFEVSGPSRHKVTVRSAFGQRGVDSLRVNAARNNT